MTVSDKCLPHVKDRGKPSIIKSYQLIPNSLRAEILIILISFCKIQYSFFYAIAKM